MDETFHTHIHTDNIEIQTKNLGDDQCHGFADKTMTSPKSKLHLSLQLR